MKKDFLKEYNNLVIENEKLKQELEKRKGIFQITCKKCGKIAHFFISLEDIDDEKRAVMDFLNCNYYLAKKCDNNN